MSLAKLDQLIQLHLSSSNIPSKIEVKNAFNQSMVIGVDETVNRLKTTQTWRQHYQFCKKLSETCP